MDRICNSKRPQFAYEQKDRYHSPQPISFVFNDKVKSCFTDSLRSVQDFLTRYSLSLAVVSRGFCLGSAGAPRDSSGFHHGFDCVYGDWVVELCLSSVCLEAVDSRRTAQAGEAKKRSRAYAEATIPGQF